MALRLAALSVVVLTLMIPLYWLLVTTFKTPAEMSAWPIAFWPHTSHVGLILGRPQLDRFQALCLGFGRAGRHLHVPEHPDQRHGGLRLRAPERAGQAGILRGDALHDHAAGHADAHSLGNIIDPRVHLIGTYWPWGVWRPGQLAIPVLSVPAVLFHHPGGDGGRAILDGCGWARIFVQIFLPLSKPVLATSLILSFQATWGDFLTPTNLYWNQNNTTLAVAVTSLIQYPNVGGAPIPQIGPVAAGELLYVLPVLGVFFLFQRYFVQGKSSRPPVSS